MVWSIARHPHGHEVPIGVLNKRDSARCCGRSGPSSRSLRVQIQIQIFIRNGTKIKLLKRRHRRHKSRAGNRSNLGVKGDREPGNRARWLYPCSTVAPGGGVLPRCLPEYVRSHRLPARPPRGMKADNVRKCWRALCVCLPRLIAGQSPGR